MWDQYQSRLLFLIAFMHALPERNGNKSRLFHLRSAPKVNDTLWRLSPSRWCYLYTQVEALQVSPCHKPLILKAHLTHLPKRHLTAHKKPRECLCGSRQLQGRTVCSWSMWLFMAQWDTMACCLPLYLWWLALPPALLSNSRLHMVRESLSGRKDGWGPVRESHRAV